MNTDCAEPKEGGLIKMGPHCLKTRSADKVLKLKGSCIYFYSLISKQIKVAQLDCFSIFKVHSL